MHTDTRIQGRAGTPLTYCNHPEHADADALSAPFMFNPRKPQIKVDAGDEGPELILHYLRYAPWSAKVEMALRHMGLLGSKVLLRDVDILAWFDPKHSPVAYLWDRDVPRMIPLLEDVTRGKALADSTPILRYLEQRFPDAPRLFPVAGQVVEEFCIDIDSGLALSARRLFITKLVLDCRDVLGWAYGGAHHPRLLRGWRSLVHQTLMSATLIRRLGLVQNVEEGLYDRVRTQMDAAAAALGDRRWLFEEFGAADITMAASIASLVWVPWLREDPRYSQLFAHQARVCEQLGMKHQVPSIVRGILDARPQTTPAWRRLTAIPYCIALKVYLWATPSPRPNTSEPIYGQVFASEGLPGSDLAHKALNDQRPIQQNDVRSRVRLLFDYAFRSQHQRPWLETGRGPLGLGGRTQSLAE